MVEFFAGAPIVPTAVSSPKRHPSPLAWVAGASSAALVGSLYHVWFTAPGSPSDGFFLGVEGAFQATEYPVKIVVRLIVVIAAVVVGELVVRAAIDLAPWSVGRPRDSLLDRLLVGATALNFVFVLVVLSFPPRRMVRFPGVSACPAAYFGFAAAVVALACSVLATRLE